MFINVNKLSNQSNQTELGHMMNRQASRQCFKENLRNEDGNMKKKLGFNVALHHQKYFMIRLSSLHWTKYAYLNINDFSRGVSHC